MKNEITQWDTFISYRSKNVKTARRVAEYLIASGLKVWFAEYEILLKDRANFLSHIDKGIEHSSTGIVFTNDDYAASLHCQHEMNKMLKHIGPDKILQVHIPAESRTAELWPQLLKAKAHIFDGDIPDTLAFIAKNTNWGTIKTESKQLPSSLRNFKGKCLGYPYVVDISGWELIQKSFHGGGPCCVIRIGQNDLYWNLQYGLEMDPKVYTARSSWDEKDERELFDSIYEYASRYIRKYQSEQSVKGVHFVPLFENNHIAITYFDGKFWKRRYSIMWLHPRSNEAAEFVFTFQFDGSFEDFLLNSSLMDELVASLEWKNKKSGFMGWIN